jgi:hypothetical protein
VPQLFAMFSAEGSSICPQDNLSWREQLDSLNAISICCKDARKRPGHFSLSSKKENYESKKNFTQPN